MPSYEVNETGLAQARRLIRDGAVDRDAEWSKAAPSTDEENAYIDEHGHEEFQAWHLALDPEAGAGTKGRCAFPYGDFRVVDRSAVVHARQRASQYGHDDVERAAASLLELLDADRD